MNQYQQDLYAYEQKISATGIDDPLMKNIEPPPLFVNPSDFINQMAELGYVEYASAADKRQPIPVIDYKFENMRLNSALATLKNVCLDAYDDGSNINGKFYSKSTKSTFYNNNGVLTELGKSTKNGGFVLQKYVKVKFHSYQSYRDYYTQIGKNLEDNLTENTFNMLLEKIKTKVLNLGETDTYTQTEYNPDLYPDGLTPWGEPEPEVITIEEAESGVINPDKHILLSYKQFDWVLLELAMNTLNFNLDEIFQYIKHGVRLVYVMPHDIDIASPQKKNEFSQFVEHTRRRPAIGSIPIGTEIDSNLEQIEHLLYGFYRADDEQANLKQYIFSQKIYQIREPTNAVAGDSLEFEDILTAGAQFGTPPPPPPEPIDNRLASIAYLESIDFWDVIMSSMSLSDFATPLVQAQHAKLLFDTWYPDSGITLYPEAIVTWYSYLTSGYEDMLDEEDIPKYEEQIQEAKLKIFGEYATQTCEE
jgi:hypothetical protein